MHRAVVDFAISLNMQHELPRRVPGVHQHCAKLKLFAVNPQVEHFSGMVEFGFTIFRESKDAIINEPELTEFRVEIDASDDADATDH